MGNRGIFRVWLRFGKGSVMARAQSKSVRGTPFTVDTAVEHYDEKSKSARTLAIEKAMRSLLDPKV